MAIPLKLNELISVSSVEAFPKDWIVLFKIDIKEERKPIEYQPEVWDHKIIFYFHWGVSFSNL